MKITKTKNNQQAIITWWYNNRPFRLKQRGSDYKLTKIPKKSGGYRTIASPSANIRIMQSELKDILEKKYKIHNSALAYKKNCSIKTNGLRHRNNNFFYKFDFSDFFGSISGEHIKNILTQKEFYQAVKSSSVWAAKESRGSSLQQGSLTAPILSNLVMYEFDKKLTNYATRNKMVYTRYADDIVLSSRNNRKISIIQTVIIESLKECGLQDIKLNVKKTQKGKIGGKLWLTGIVINKNREVTTGWRYKKRLKVSMFKMRKNKRRWSHRVFQDQLAIMLGQLSYLNYTVKNRQYTPSWVAEQIGLPKSLNVQTIKDLVRELRAIRKG